MKSRYDDLKDFVLDSGSSRALICLLHGYTADVCVSKMRKSDLARIFLDVQYMLRVAYEERLV